MTQRESQRDFVRGFKRDFLTEAQQSNSMSDLTNMCMKNAEKVAVLSLALAGCAPDVDIREATGLDQETKELVYAYRQAAVIACFDIPKVDGAKTPTKAIEARKEAERVLTEKGCEPELVWDCWFDENKRVGSKQADNSVTAPFETEVGGNWMGDDCSHVPTGDLIAESVYPITATATQIGVTTYTVLRDFFVAEEEKSNEGSEEKPKEVKPE